MTCIKIGFLFSHLIRKILIILLVIDNVGNIDLVIFVDQCCHMKSVHCTSDSFNGGESDLITKITQNVGTNLRFCYYCFSQCHLLSHIQNMEICVQHCKVRFHFNGESKPVQ